jgi:hypothetical protein
MLSNWFRHFGSRRSRCFLRRLTQIKETNSRGCSRGLQAPQALPRPAPGSLAMADCSIPFLGRPNPASECEGQSRGLAGIENPLFQGVKGGFRGWHWEC